MILFILIFSPFLPFFIFSRLCFFPLFHFHEEIFDSSQILLLFSLVYAPASTSKVRELAQRLHNSVSSVLCQEGRPLFFVIQLFYFILVTYTQVHVRVRTHTHPYTHSLVINVKKSAHPVRFTMNCSLTDQPRKDSSKITSSGGILFQMFVMLYLGVGNNFSDCQIPSILDFCIFLNIPG